MTILLLGGTAEARALAAALVAADVPALSSLAGRVERPALPAGPVRVGGFGGVAGLVEFLRQARIDRIVDATHPFAATISAHAAAAAQATGTPLLRLERPGWSAHPDAQRWTWVDSLAHAAGAGRGYKRPFLTTGRQSLAAFAGWRNTSVLVRLVDPPAEPLPTAWTVLLARGPYDPGAEEALMRAQGCDALITKDSGGTATAGKLTAATALQLPVLVVRRPRPPAGVRTVPTVTEALATLGR